MIYAQLTLGDHEQNGFVAVAQFHGFKSVDALRKWVSAFEPITTERDDTAPYEFLLDGFEGPGEQIEEVMPIPTQIARRLAPEAVDGVLAERPDPDSVSDRVYAILAVPCLEEFGL